MAAAPTIRNTRRTFGLAGFAFCSALSAMPDKDIVHRFARIVFEQAEVSPARLFALASAPPEADQVA